MYYGELLDVKFPLPTINNFANLLDRDNIFPKRLSSWSLEHQPLREPQLFICNAKNTLDIIDYWNLRAAGYYAVPIAIQMFALDSIRELCRDFIEENYLPRIHNPKSYESTLIHISRSISFDEAKAFCASLGVSRGKNKELKYSFQNWYPRLWDRWARENTREGVKSPYAYKIDMQISDNQEKFELRSNDPKFKLSRIYSGQPKYANDFFFRFYSLNEPMTEVFPEGSRNLSSAIGRTIYLNLRFSTSGPVFLARYEKELIFLDLPRAEPVMIAWLKERGWDAKLSPSGLMATLLYKQLGGIYGFWMLAHKGLIQLLKL